MIDKHPNPWNFSNTNKALVPLNNIYKIVYYDLNEIAMGAPLGGQCFLEAEGNKKVLIHDWCGGPPAWETAGQLIAIPVWSRTSLKGIVQQIGIADTKAMKFKIFEKTFRVLNLHAFDNNIIKGYDSPIHQQTAVTFDIDSEKIATIINLVG